MCLTSFGDDSTEPPAFPCCRDDVMVDKGAAAPRSYLLPVEMRTWSISCRHSLYSDEDHLSPAAFLVLPDRRDEFYDTNPIRHDVLQPFLKNESFENDKKYKLCCSILGVLQVVRTSRTVIYL